MVFQRFLHTLALLATISGCNYKCAAVPKGPPDEGFIINNSHELKQDVKKIPLVIVVDPSAAAWKGEMDDACNEWNARLGFTAFIFLGVIDQEVDPVPGIVPVFIDEKKENRADTYFSADISNGRLLMTFVVMPVGSYSPRIARLFCMHELGHVLGLAHDEKNPRSLMFPHLEGQGEGIDITQHDLDLLRATYGKYAASSSTIAETPQIP